MFRNLNQGDKTMICRKIVLLKLIALFRKQAHPLKLTVVSAFYFMQLQKAWLYLILWIAVEDYDWVDNLQVTRLTSVKSKSWEDDPAIYT